MKLDEVMKELVDLKKKYDLLNKFVEIELGLDFKKTPCAAPVNYCDGCKCGKKERIEKALK